MLYVGIDQHRKQLTVSVRDESGNVLVRRQVSTEWQKVRAFFSELCESAKSHGLVPPITMETRANGFFRNPASRNALRRTMTPAAHRIMGGSNR